MVQRTFCGVPDEPIIALIVRVCLYVCVKGTCDSLGVVLVDEEPGVPFGPRSSRGDLGSGRDVSLWDFLFSEHVCKMGRECGRARGDGLAAARGVGEIGPSHGLGWWHGVH